MATVEAPSASRESEFVAWLSSASLSVTVATKREHEQWYALLPQFDITGTGATVQDAVQDALELLIAYLRAYFDDGCDFQAAVRPIPRQLKIRIHTESLIGHALRRISEHVPFASEDTYELPPGALASMSHC